jgi:hypothetical protein
MTPFFPDFGVFRGITQFLHGNARILSQLDDSFIPDPLNLSFIYYPGIRQYVTSGVEVIVI